MYRSPLLRSPAPVETSAADLAPPPSPLPPPAAPPPAATVVATGKRTEREVELETELETTRQRLARTEADKKAREIRLSELEDENRSFKKAGVPAAAAPAREASPWTFFG